MERERCNGERERDGDRDVMERERDGERCNGEREMERDVMKRERDGERDVMERERWRFKIQDGIVICATIAEQSLAMKFLCLGLLQ